MALFCLSFPDLENKHFDGDCILSILPFRFPLQKEIKKKNGCTLGKFVVKVR